MKFYLQLFLLFCTGFVLAAPPRLLKNIKLSIHVVDGDGGSDEIGSKAGTRSSPGEKHYIVTISSFFDQSLFIDDMNLIYASNHKGPIQFGTLVNCSFSGNTLSLPPKFTYYESSHGEFSAAELFPSPESQNREQVFMHRMEDDTPLWFNELRGVLLFKGAERLFSTFLSHLKSCQIRYNPIISNVRGTSINSTYQIDSANNKRSMKVEESNITHSNAFKSTLLVRPKEKKNKTRAENSNFLHLDDSESILSKDVTSYFKSHHQPFIPITSKNTIDNRDTTLYDRKNAHVSSSKKDNNIRTLDTDFIPIFLEENEEMKNKLLSLHSPPVFRTAGTGEKFCEEDPTSNACHAIKRRWADELNYMWPKLAGISSNFYPSVNHTSTQSNSVDKGDKDKINDDNLYNPFTSHRPLNCPNHAMKNILPFPNFPPGNISLLRSEISKGTNAVVLGSTLSNFAMALGKKQFIQIDTSYHDVFMESGEVPLPSVQKARITMDRTLHARQFLPGDYIALYGFKHTHNKGIFQVLKNVNDDTFEISNLDIGSYRAGKVEDLQYESNAWSGRIIGCYTRGVSTTTATGGVITIYGNHAGDQRHWVKYPTKYDSNNNIKQEDEKPIFDLGELVRLEGFSFHQNNGVFRVTGNPATGIIRLGNIGGCSANLNCNKLESNTKDPTFESIQTNNFYVNPVANKPCPTKCNGHGTCYYNENKTNGYGCHCDSTWVGDDCSLPALACPFNCSNHGTCDVETGKCYCMSSWTGLACNEAIQPCPNRCSGHGVCQHEAGHCVCDSTFCGIDCGTPCNVCPSKCSGHGRCDLKLIACYCDATWGGIDCSLPINPCPNACSGHGKCEVSTGTCYCEKGWVGLSCEKCPCGKHGYCNATNPKKCICHPTWTGEKCNIPIIPCPTARLGLPCSGNGNCDETIGKCMCEDGWGGLDCAYHVESCPRCDDGALCGGHGMCDFTVGKCRCDYDYGGEACCGKHFCPENCGSSSHGYCNKTTGRCHCRRAWTGADCLEPLCGAHGIMLPDGSCRGDSGWYPPIQGAVCERVGNEIIFTYLQN